MYSSLQHQGRNTREISNGSNISSNGTSPRYFSATTTTGFGSVTTIHGSGKSNNKSLLTVFQAAPLAYAEGSCYHPVGVLDFESERQLLTDSLSDAAIDISVVFDIATAERFGDFLAKGEGRVLHFSCHGHPDYLAIENGYGAMHKLAVEDLKGWIQAGGDNLLFVFVSACHSRSAGEAFLQAGVKHVVCCQQDDQPIRNVSSMLFARAFYHALANGCVLCKAFELARQQVLNCPHLDRNERRKEVNKFALLPQDCDHKVAIFEPSYGGYSSPPRSVQPIPPSSTRILPVPPHILEGRQVEIFRVLDALKAARVVRVSGIADGIGKASVVQGVCQYIQERRHLFWQKISDIIWLPQPTEVIGQDDLSRLMTKFCAIFDDPVETDEDYARSYQQILGYLYENRVLMVIDARQVKSPAASFKIASFLEDVIVRTTRTRVICIHHPNDEMVTRKLPCNERDFSVGPLDFASSVRLFGRLCQHVTDQRYPGISNHVDLCQLLVPDGHCGTKPQSRRRRDIFKLIGDGIPDKILHAAKTISEKDYERMISLGLRKEYVPEFNSRAALEKELDVLATEIQKAVEEKRFLDAQECQERLDEMEVLRENLPDLETLTTLADSVKIDQQRATKQREFLAAARLQEELDALEKKIKTERQAMEELGIREEDFKPSALEEKKNETRVDLEVQISTLEIDLEKACDRNDIALARRIDAQVQDLKARRPFLPSREELRTQKEEFSSSLDKAKETRNWDLAEEVLAKIREIDVRIDAEIQASSRFEKASEEKGTTNLNATIPGAMAVPGPSSHHEAVQREPSGEHVNEMRDLIERLEERDMLLEQEDMMMDIRDSLLPVAQAVSGSGDESDHTEEEVNDEEIEGTNNLTPRFRFDAEQSAQRTQNGLCTKCGETQTHYKSGDDWWLSEWIPREHARDCDGKPLVYKGFCLKPGCYTLDEAKQQLGEFDIIVEPSALRAHVGEPTLESPALESSSSIGQPHEDVLQSGSSTASDVEKASKTHLQRNEDDVSTVIHANRPEIASERKEEFNAAIAMMNIGRGMAARAQREPEQQTQNIAPPAPPTLTPPPTPYQRAPGHADRRSFPGHHAYQATAAVPAFATRTRMSEPIMATLHTDTQHHVSPHRQMRRQQDGFHSTGEENDDDRIAWGHTNRLVLEQIIQESISNMCVPAVKVEKVDPPDRPKNAKGKKSIIGDFLNPLRRIKSKDPGTS